MTVREDVNDRAEGRVGKVLKGKWRLDSVLGIGGMACVYAATHRNRSRVAIKMLHPEVAVSQDVTTRFLREGYVGNAVAHPGSVKVLDDDITEDGAPFLVMELLEGESLGARLDREGTLPAHEVVLIADQLLDVLAAAHLARIVHRDLEPDNVFLTLEGRLKVLDFGIARLREAAQESSASTQVGSLLGTPAFMAPEQALGRWKDVDGRTDIWSVGATLFSLLTGCFVHEADTLQAQLVLAATAKARTVSSLAPATPDWLASIVDRALAFDPEARFPDARSMQAALRAAAVGFEFPPLLAPGSASISGSFAASRPFTPLSAAARLISAPVLGAARLGGEATVVVPEVADAVSLQSGAGTFASVQGVARSAQPSERRRPRPALLVGALLLLAGAGGLGLYWRSSSEPAAAELGAASAPASVPIEAVKPPASPHAPAVPASAATSSLAPPPASVVSVALPPVPPSAAELAGVGARKPPKPHPKNDPKSPQSAQENLFDSRH